VLDVTKPKHLLMKTSLLIKTYTLQIAKAKNLHPCNQTIPSDKKKTNYNLPIWLVFDMFTPYRTIATLSKNLNVQTK
jgi:hypothetical protein